ncbi:YeeE/YedE thiosulfate transporter family protein [Pectinatus frisingensis]|uniref:YeeE/YedE thiosulfate transporter family protein n=1 Tax=Pectinatus frisingensis TaxID=865 RepID=UPI0018C85E21|nr:YeeE/YedE thiosulfate transporter family protein [Pectinatus frisingensis]
MDNTSLYAKLLKNPWSYTTGAIILGMANITMLSITGSAWAVTTPFSYWGAWFYQILGGQPDTWFYFSQKTHAAAITAGFWNNGHSVSNIGIIFGAFLATLLASQFKIKKIKSKKQIFGAILGGLLMGYGARIAFGCNIGALFSGTASMSLHGWVFMLFIFIGAIIGSKLLTKYFI